MIVHPLPSGPFETNAYIIACEKTSAAALIDPSPGSAEALTSYIEKQGLQPQMILLTHSHWDHIAEVSTLKDLLKLPVYIHPLDAPNLTNPGSDGLPCWISIKGVVPDHLLQDGENITLGNLKLQVIHTPGHSPGGVCFWNQKENILVSGDTLFHGSIGNLSFPTSNADSMWTSLAKLAKLPPQTAVYPGHGPSTTIGNEPWLNRAKEFFGDY